MDLRVTQQSVLQNALSDSQRLTSQLAALQVQASSGKKFSNVSDDPAASLAILAGNAQDQLFGAHLDNVQTAQTALNTSVSALQQVSTIFTTARSIAVEASNSNNDTSSFGAMASQVDALIDQLLSAANTQQNNTYVFGGTAGKTQPFVVAGADAQGHPLQVQYQGSADGTSAIVNTQQQMQIYYSGSNVFMTTNRQPAQFTGNTGAKAGAGTDTATGTSQLVFQHTATTYDAGSGVQPGTNSATGDTILGAVGQHVLHITDTSGTGAAGTVSLDGGPSVAFSNADTNLKVTAANGDIVYLDTSAITANFDGNVDITSDGTISSDGGATSTPITFNADQYVTNPQNGQVVFVDSSQVARIGTETVAHPGTSNAFQALIDLRDQLRNVNNLSPQDQIAALSNQIGELDNVHANILTTIGNQSASLQSLTALQSNLQDMQTSAKQTVSNLGDLDYSQFVVQLQSYQNMLQLSLATFARINGQSLLDFLH